MFSSSSGFKKKYSNASLKLLGFGMRAHCRAQLGPKVELFCLSWNDTGICKRKSVYWPAFHYYNKTPEVVKLKDREGLF